MQQRNLLPAILKRTALVALWLACGGIGHAQITYSWQADFQDASSSSTAVAATPAAGTLTNAGNTLASSATGPGGPNLPLSLNLDGSNDYISFPAITASSNTVTYMMFVRATAPQTNAYTGLMYSRGSGSDIGGLMFAPVASTNKLGYTWANSPVAYNYNSGPTIPTAKWCLAALAMSGSSAKFYVVEDTGTTTTTHTTAWSAMNYLQALRIGNDGNANRNFNGRVAGGRIATSTLSQAQIEAFFATALPSNSVAPAVTGTVGEGQTLTAAAGAWTNGTITRQWFTNSINSTSGGTPIVGANSTTYTVVTGDVGKYIYMRERSTSDIGFVDSLSNVVGPIIGTPANSVAPVASGTATEDETLSVTSGTWSNSPTYTYQWFRNASNSTSGGSSIGGATSSTYTLTVTDIGQYVYCRVTGTTIAGNASVFSNILGPIASGSISLADADVADFTVFTSAVTNSTNMATASYTTQADDYDWSPICFRGRDLVNGELATCNNSCVLISERFALAAWHCGPHPGPSPGPVVCYFRASDGDVFEATVAAQENIGADWKLVRFTADIDGSVGRMPIVTNYKWANFRHIWSVEHNGGVSAQIPTISYAGFFQSVAVSSSGKPNVIPYSNGKLGLLSLHWFSTTTATLTPEMRATLIDRLDDYGNTAEFIQIPDEGPIRYIDAPLPNVTRSRLKR